MNGSYVPRRYDGGMLLETRQSVNGEGAGPSRRDAPVAVTTTASRFIPAPAGATTDKEYDLAPDRITTEYVVPARNPN